MEWLGAVWLIFCLFADERKALKGVTTKPYDDVAFRRANGLPITDAEIEAAFSKFRSQK